MLIFPFLHADHNIAQAMAGLRQCCASGSLHSGEAKGRFDTIHGLETYIADAPSGQPKGIVVIIPDAFGIALPNNKILADVCKPSICQDVQHPLT